MILVPDTTAGGAYTYKRYAATDLFGYSRRILRSTSGFGLAPLHFITQRGPYQDGDTALDMRLDPRVIRLVIADTLYKRQDYWDRRNTVLDLLRPNRSFDGTTRPLIYQKWLPGGKLEHGTDLVTTAWSTAVTSATGRFVERGLGAGDAFDITTGSDQGRAVVAEVLNDYTVVLEAPPGHTATGIHYTYRRGWARRNLYCLLQHGPTFDEGPDAAPTAPTGYREALRFIANDPCWYSDAVLTHTWDTSMTAIGALTFDGTTGAWFGAAGQWLFNISYVGQATNIIYWGTVRAKPTITITGPAANPSIENATTGTSIRMEYEIQESEIVTINTLALTVTNDSNENLLPYTTGNLATFGLEPAPQAPNRINDVRVRFAGATSNSATVMTWRNRYSGI